MRNGLIKDQKIELLISFLTSANVLGVLSAKKNRIPVIISERNNPHIETTNKFWSFLRNRTYPKANTVVVQTKIIEEFYIKKLNLNNLAILPNPISKELSLKRDTSIIKDNIILNIGRLSNQKKQRILIEAFSKITNNNWKLIIIGEGELRHEYNDLITKLNLQERVTLLGNTQNVSKYYNSSKIFAFSSIYEGFPNALIEAMHYGLACISTDCPTGPSELINNGSNGFLIPMNDVDLMSKKIQLLVNNEKSQRVFGEKAKESVKKFEVDNVIKEWQYLIESALN